MVGDPKHLSDVLKIEADVRITCRRCGLEQDWTVEALTAHLLAIDGSTVWSEVTRYMRYLRFGCGSSRLQAVPVPYARRQPNLRRRIGRVDEKLVETAMAVLEEATARSPGRDVVTLEVRLALLVVHRYIRDAATIRLFWERAGNSRRTGNEGVRDQCSTIRFRLEQAGWLASNVLLQRPPHWGWQSPAPRGWTSRTGHVSDDDEPGTV